MDDVMNKLKEIPEIIDVHKVQGTYDIIARVHSDTEEKLMELVSERIRRIDRIIGSCNSHYSQRNRELEKRAYDKVRNPHVGAQRTQIFRSFIKVYDYTSKYVVRG